MPASLKLLKANLKPNTKPIVKYAFAKSTQDGLYYRGHVLKLDPPNKKCLFRYLNDAELWIDLADIHVQLILSRIPQDKIICTLCEGSQSETPNQIVICDMCEQGYHQRCHDPIITDSSIDTTENDIEWMCATCYYITKDDNDLEVKSSKSSRRLSIETKPSSSEELVIETHKTQDENQKDKPSNRLAKKHKTRI